MKTIPLVMVWLLILCVCSPGLSFAAEPAHVSGEELKRETKEALEKARAYAEQQKQEYTKKMQAKLDDLSKKIDQLKEMAKGATGDALARIQTSVADLVAKQDAARRKLEELGSSTTSAWDTLKVGVEKAVADLQKAYEGAAAHFK